MTDPLALPYVEAAQRLSLILQTCNMCGAKQLPPRLRCESCGGLSLGWEPAAGTGMIHTFTVLHRAPDDFHRQRVPYVYAVIELDEVRD